MENTNKNSKKGLKLFSKKQNELPTTAETAVSKDGGKAVRKESKVAEGVGKGVQKAKSFFKRVLVGLLILGVLSGGIFMLYANYVYSEGTRAGSIIKISKKGLLFKTYEGQLKLGGIDLQNVEEGISDTWNFSVKDQAIVAKIEQLQGQKVIVRYKEINRAMPWQGDTNYFVYEVTLSQN